jgi:hypothetical protein
MDFRQKRAVFSSEHRPFLFVEMAGIEPASERFVPRTSTSVVVCELSLNTLQTTKDRVQPAARARKPSFAQLAASSAALRLLCRPLHPRLEFGDGRT